MNLLVLMVNKSRLMQIGDSENRFRELFDKMKSGVAAYEAVDGGNDFVFKDFNRAAENIDQLSKADVVGRSVVQVFPAIKEFGLFEVLQNVWRDGVPRHHPVVNTRAVASKDGERIISTNFLPEKSLPSTMMLQKTKKWRRSFGCLQLQTLSPDCTIEGAS